MKKINFENLPSTNTPINAANLNQIQSNVEEVFNGAETMGNIVVNDIKCKNLFNKYSYTKGYLVTITGELATNNGYGASDFIPVKAGQNYYQQGTNTYYSVLYDENYNFVSHINSNSFTPSQDGYMRTSFSLTNIDTVQVAIGSKETEYTNYKKYDLNTYEIPVTISNGNTYQNDLLKNAKFVVVNWMPSDGSWSMQTLHIQNGYSLNTYGSYSVGSVFNSTDGTIKYNYSTDGNMNITKILIIK